MYSVNLALDWVDWTQTATVVISGVVIVLGVLLVLIAIFIGFGSAVSKSENAAKKKTKKKDKNNQNADETIAPANIKSASASSVKSADTAALAGQSGVNGEVVAAITAAIAASEGNGQFVIRSIKKKNVSTRNPWAAAAIIENTKPF